MRGEGVHRGLVEWDIKEHRSEKYQATKGREYVNSSTRSSLLLTRIVLYPFGIVFFLLGLQRQALPVLFSSLCIGSFVLGYVALRLACGT